MPFIAAQLKDKEITFNYISLITKPYEEQTGAGRNKL